MNFKGSSKDVPRKKNIFINYRVQDTAGETGRLVDRLKQRFSDDQIFMDIDKIEPGVDFTKAISKSLESCDIMLAIIGPQWLGKDSAKNTSRIKQPNDWVKTEISTALQRDIRVVPVLVDGGQLPDADDLPPDLQPLLLRQSYEISNKRWDYDTQQLIEALIRSGITPKPSPPPLPVPGEKKTWWKKNSWWVYIMIGVTITVSLLVNNAENSESGITDPIQQQNNLQNSRSTEPDYSSETTETATDNATGAAVGDITGTWVESDEGIASTFMITQNGNNLAVQVYSMNQLLSNGTGSISGSSVQLNITLFELTAVVNGTLAADGKTIKGTYNIATTGDVQPITLVKQ